MTKELLEQLSTNQSLTEGIKDGVPFRLKIMTDLSDQMKEVQDAYIQVLIECNYEGIADLYAKQKNDPKNDAIKDEIKAWKSKVRKQFGIIKHIIHPNPGQDIIGSLISKIVLVAKMLKYIGHNELEDQLAANGIKIDVKTIEFENDKFDNDDIRARMSQIWTDADEVQGEICTNADEVKINIFERLDTSIKFDSKTNKSGLKAGDFVKLVKNKAIGEVKDKETYTKYMDKRRKENQHTIDKEQLMLEKNKQM